MTPLQQVKEKIYEACPELRVPCTCPKGGVYEAENGLTLICPKCDGVEYVNKKEIQLNHILRAVEKSPTDYKATINSRGFLHIEDKALYGQKPNIKKPTRIGIDYNLTLTAEENLENEEFCKFLHEILCQK